MKKINAPIPLAVILVPAWEPAPVAAPEPPAFRHEAFHGSLREWAEELTKVDGDGKEDWGDGRLAVPEDTVLVCAGCNLQLRYTMWYRQQVA